MQNKQEMVCKGNILVYDDDIGIVDSLKYVIEKQGFQVDGVTNTQEMMSKLKQNNYDILLLDYYLEDCTAETIIPMVRTISDSVGIILLTGYITEFEPIVNVIRNYDIQGYSEKGTNFINILLQIDMVMRAKRVY